MLEAALLWYRKFKNDLEEYRFMFNPYDPCVANQVVDGKQQTIIFHVENIKSSKVKKEVNDEFLVWLNEKYGKYVEVTATRGNVHKYLGMKLFWCQLLLLLIAMVLILILIIILPVSVVRIIL